ncbi:MAG TPA: prepilin-type N-terminal cleavage/methylation domain-containing protein [Deltaproteobacteria bacterium]|jgi:type IV pilus assembly protein PilV|nr:prepilin-type N-terminal cleavage/methylation domain-containing protein [Deltaproteobacteria bacterium]
MKSERKEHDPIFSMADGGFTLIELIIAVVIFSIGILGVAALHYESIRGTDFAMQITRANSVSEDLTEYLKALPYACDSFGGSAPITGQINRAAEDVNNESTGRIPYRRTWFVTQARDSSNNIVNDARLVTVQTWWDNNNHHISFTFYKNRD